MSTPEPLSRSSSPLPPISWSLPESPLRFVLTVVALDLVVSETTVDGVFPLAAFELVVTDTGAVV